MEARAGAAGRGGVTCARGRGCPGGAGAACSWRPWGRGADADWARADWAPVGAGRRRQPALPLPEVAVIPAHSQRGKLRRAAGRSVVWKRGAAEPWAGAGRDGTLELNVLVWERSRSFIRSFMHSFHTRASVHSTLRNTHQVPSSPVAEEQL